MSDRDMNPKISRENIENRPVENKPLSTADMAVTGPAETQRDVQSPAMRATGGSGHPMPLLNPDEMTGMRSHWTDIQSGFVDEPRHAVEEADHLVAEVMQKLAQTFARERSNLENQWNQGENVSTEDLRIALQRYRSFFDRLLSL